MSIPTFYHHSLNLLVNVEDVFGCKRSLSVPGVAVNVKRVKVKVYFWFSARGTLKTAILLVAHCQVLCQGWQTADDRLARRECTSAPEAHRRPGKGICCAACEKHLENTLQPWTIKYRRVDDLHAGAVKVSLLTPNDQLSVFDAGLYELLEVSILVSPFTVFDQF